MTLEPVLCEARVKNPNWNLFPPLIGWHAIKCINIKVIVLIKLKVSCHRFASNNLLCAIRTFLLGGFVLDALIGPFQIWSLHIINLIKNLLLSVFPPTLFPGKNWNIIASSALYKYKVILWPEFWVPHCVILFLPPRNDIKPANLGLPYDYSFKTSKMLGQEKDYQQLPGGRRWYEIWSLKFDNCPPHRSASLCATYKYIFVLPKYMCTSIICAQGIFRNICIIWGLELVDCCKVEFGMRAVEITQAEECSFCIMYKKKPSPPNLSHIWEKKECNANF